MIAREHRAARARLIARLRRQPAQRPRRGPRPSSAERGRRRCRAAPGPRSRCRPAARRAGAASCARSRRVTRCRTTLPPDRPADDEPDRAAGCRRVGRPARWCTTTRAAARATATASDDGGEVGRAAHPVVAGSTGRRARTRGRRPASGRQLAAALAAAGGDDGAAGAGAHAQPEAVRLGATAVVRLEGALAHGRGSKIGGSRCRTGGARRGWSQGATGSPDVETAHAAVERRSTDRLRYGSTPRRGSNRPGPAHGRRQTRSSRIKRNVARFLRVPATTRRKPIVVRHATLLGSPHRATLTDRVASSAQASDPRDHVASLHRLHRPVDNSVDCCVHSSWEGLWIARGVRPVVRQSHTAVTGREHERRTSWSEPDPWTSSTELLGVWDRARTRFDNDDALRPQQKAWLSLTRPLGLVEDTALLAAPNEFVREYLENHLRPYLAVVLSEELGRTSRSRSPCRTRTSRRRPDDRRHRPRPTPRPARDADGYDDADDEPTSGSPASGHRAGRDYGEVAHRTATAGRRLRPGAGVPSATPATPG